ncbi:MAG TPA: Smr/MutS family protein [Clostridia bacterium]|nr:Smr/MutS family protein [Clostridia bacterium]
MVNYITSQKVEIDIHNMKRAEAKTFLERFLSNANGNVKEIIVIHGYASGTVLRDMVRRSLKHRRIKQKIISLNPGVTTLLLD